MISVISPAKSMNFKPQDSIICSSVINKIPVMKSTLEQMKNLSVADIMRIMKVSEKIAKLNYERFNNFDSLPEKQALFAYNGNVYNNIDTATLNNDSLDFAQNHLRILSALYGLLRPLDLIKAYRLEMSCKLDEIAPKGMSIFWKKTITHNINSLLKNHKNKFLINLASNEYSASIDKKSLEAELINLHFRQNRDGNIKNIAISAKNARGMMVDFIIRNKIDDPCKIKEFSNNQYVFDKQMSDFNNFYFICN